MTEHLVFDADGSAWIGNVSFFHVQDQQLLAAPRYAELTPVGRSEIVHVITTLEARP